MPASMTKMFDWYLWMHYSCNITFKECRMLQYLAEKGKIFLFSCLEVTWSAGLRGWLSMWHMLILHFGNIQWGKTIDMTSMVQMNVYQHKMWAILVWMSQHWFNKSGGNIFLKLQPSHMPHTIEHRVHLANILKFLASLFICDGILAYDVILNSSY